MLSTINWHFPSTSTRIKSCAATAADFQHPLKGGQGGEQKWGTLCSGKNCRTRLQIVKYFLELILWAQFLHLLISRKALKSFMVTFCSSWLAVTFTRLAEAFCKKYVLDWRYSPFTKITCLLTFSPASLEQFLRAIWDAISWAIVLILPQIKLNSQL